MAFEQNSTIASHAETASVVMQSPAPQAHSRAYSRQLEGLPIKQLLQGRRYLHWYDSTGHAGAALFACAYAVRVIVYMLSMYTLCLCICQLADPVLANMLSLVKANKAAHV